MYKISGSPLLGVPSIGKIDLEKHLTDLYNVTLTDLYISFSLLNHQENQQQETAICFVHTPAVVVACTIRAARNQGNRTVHEAQG